jgi:hypothetical protein
LRFKVSPGKKFTRPYFKSNLHKNGSDSGSKNACLASVKPWVRTPLPPVSPVAGRNMAILKATKSVRSLLMLFRPKLLNEPKRSKEGKVGFKVRHNEMAECWR